MQAIEAGTDGATLAVFDPQVFPPDFDSDMGRAADELSRLAALGRVARLETGGDGDFLVHVFVAEPIPDELTPCLREPLVFDAFPVPSGRLYVTGAEYIFHADTTRLRGHLEDSVALDAGVHRLSIYRTEYPEGVMEGLLKAQVAPWIYSLHQGFGCALGLALAVAIGAGFIESGAVGLTTFAVCVLLLLALRRAPPFREAEAKWKRIQRRFPSIVIVVDGEVGDTN